MIFGLGIFSADSPRNCLSLRDKNFSGMLLEKKKRNPKYLV